MLRSELAGAVVADAGRPMWFGRRGERARMIASFPHLNKLPHSTLFTMRPHLSFFFFFSPVSIRRTGDEKPRAPILSSLSNYFRYNRFFLSIYCIFSSRISFVVIDNLARRDENYGFIYSLKGIDY